MTARIAAAITPFEPEIEDLMMRTMPPGRPPLVLFTTLARDARLFKKFFAGGLLDRGHLTLRQRELVIARTTASCRSEYEWGVHVLFFAKRVGFDDEQVYSLVHGVAGDDCWGSNDRLVLQACDALHAKSTLSDALWTSLRAEFTEEALLEILLLAGYYRTVSYLTNALRLPLEADAPLFPANRR